MKHLRETGGHQNLVQLHEVLDDEDKDKLYMGKHVFTIIKIVLDFCEKGELLSWDQQTLTFKYRDSPADGIMSEATIKHFMLNMINALVYCRCLWLYHINLSIVHSKGVVHRDIKPQNILITKDNEAKLSDFGVSHWFKDSEEGSDTLNKTEGTYQFMAPECCDRKH